MNKILKLIVFLAVIIVLAYYGYPLLNKNNEAIDNNQNSSLVEKSKEIYISEETDDYLIDIKYPEFINISNIEAMSDANSILESRINDLIADFKNNIDYDFQREFNMISTISNSYKEMILNDNLVSINFGNYQYSGGAAHPNTYNESFNYDFKNNKEIKLSDVFNQNVDYLSILSSICRENLKAKEIFNDEYSQQMIDLGTEPTEAKFSNFVFEDDYLTIMFNPGQVSAYAAGLQEVRIPFSQLIEYINSELILY